MANVPLTEELVADDLLVLNVEKVGLTDEQFVEDWKKTGEVARNNAYSMKREDDMRKNDLRGLIACVALAVVPMMMVTVAVAQAPPAPQPPAPQIAPVLVPSHVVDLMTEDGISAFGARWKTLEAKIVEGQIGR